MKKLFVMAIAALCACSSAVFAQKPADNSAANSGCPYNKECKRGDRAKGDKAGRKAFNPFEGITLTADQQTKIDALQAECKAKREACKAKGECKAPENCKKGENCAKAECPAAGDKNKAAADRMQQRRDYLNKVKAILTPEQYTVFLENMAVNRPAGHHAFKGKMNRHDRKGQGMRRGDHGKAVSAKAAKPAKNAKVANN